MNITVYLGANSPSDTKLKECAAELGRYIGESGNTLIYGGSESGLMGTLAVSALEHKATVIGVEPRMFIEKEYQLDTLSKLIVTDTMAERKAKMVELGDAFIAFPGGTGTLEEISEVMSLVSLKQISAPCILYNIDGYYDDLKALLKKMKQKGLSSDERQKGIYFADDLEQIKEILEKEEKNG